jgi:Na+/H+ antiporter NhaD/arsenite permease-like protein
MSGSEAAFFSLSPQEKDKLRKAEDSRSKKVIHLISKPNELLGTILQVNNLVNILIILLSSALLSRLFDFTGHPVLEFVVCTIVVTFVLVLFGEAMPKLIGTGRPVFFSRMMSAPLSVLRPISAFFVKPNIKYIDYIDFRTLGILWSLMVIMEGLSCNGLFEKIGYKLLKKTKNVWQLSITLVFICFFSSMLITNDVALITFVPFTMMILGKCEKQNLLIPIIVLQTIAANLGSMLTPIGNPQNLYLYGLWGVNIFTFIKTILPYSIVSFFLHVPSGCS